ncbi:MAG: sigma-70 family RNA polymerase sigma factor [Ekhidna sp.]
MPNKKHLFETLHHDYWTMVQHICLGFMKGNTDLAQDLAQETFINVWRSLGTFRKEAAYKTWIYRITVNTCLQYIRKEKKKVQVSIEQEQLILQNDEEGTAQSYQELYQAIGLLKEVDRLIIMMVMDELEYSEIAQVMGMNEGTLRVRIHRIKKSLKKFLQHERSV